MRNINAHTYHLILTEFKSYHKAKANLRIVKKENNLSRTGMARVKQSTNDLKVD